MCVCVCVSGCELELFENTLQLRERRLDLEELLAEEKKSAEALKKECDTLSKKVILTFIFLSTHLICHLYLVLFVSAQILFRVFFNSTKIINPRKPCGG